MVDYDKRVSAPRFLCAVSLLTVACEVSSAEGQACGTDVEPGACGRGLVVVSTDADYAATNVSLVDFDGTILCESFASSGSTSGGLSAKLSGDVLPSRQQQSGETIALIDRGQGVLTWMDVQSGQAQAQLAVNTGFEANPYDYLELSESRAYVSRYNANLEPGREPFSGLDGGSDLLIINPSTREIVGRIDLMPALDVDESGFLPRPQYMVQAGERVYVVLAGLALDFADGTAGRVVAIDTTRDEIAQVVKFDGIYGCGGIAISPNGRTLAVACAGRTDADYNPIIEESAVVLIDVDQELRETRRISAQSFGMGAVGFSISFSDDDTLLVNTLGDALGLEDGLVRIETASDDFEIVLRRPAWTLSELSCAEGCGACFATDGSSGNIVRLDVAADGTLQESRAFEAESSIGLLPRALGLF